MSINDEHTVMVRWGTTGLWLQCETHPEGGCAWVNHLERWGYDVVLRALGVEDWLRFADKTVVHEVGGIEGFRLGPAPRPKVDEGWQPTAYGLMRAIGNGIVLTLADSLHPGVWHARLEFHSEAAPEVTTAYSRIGKWEVAAPPMDEAMAAAVEWCRRRNIDTIAGTPTTP